MTTLDNVRVVTFLDESRRLSQQANVSNMAP